MKPTLVIIPGALGAAVQFNTLKRLLADHYEILVFEIPGYGQDKHTDAFSIGHFAENLVEELSSKNIHQPFVFGYSMGAYIASYAALNLNFELKKLYSLGTKFFWDEATSKKEAAMLNYNILAEKFPKYIENLNAIHAAGAQTILEKTASLMLDLGKQPAVNPTDLAKINCPIRIAVGDSDKMIPLEAAHQVFKFCSQGSFEVVPDTRHEIDRVNPELLSQNLIRFFN